MNLWKPGKMVMPVRAIAMMPNGRALVLDYLGQLAMVDSEKGKVVRVMMVPGGISKLAMDANGLLYTGQLATGITPSVFEVGVFSVSEKEGKITLVRTLGSAAQLESIGDIAVDAHGNVLVVDQVWSDGIHEQVVILASDGTINILDQLDPAPCTLSLLQGGRVAIGSTKGRVTCF